MQQTAMAGSGAAALILSSTLFVQAVQQHSRGTLFLSNRGWPATGEPPHLSVAAAAAAAAATAVLTAGSRKDSARTWESVLFSGKNTVSPHGQSCRSRRHASLSLSPSSSVILSRLSGGASGNSGGGRGLSASSGKPRGGRGVAPMAAVGKRRPAPAHDDSLDDDDYDDEEEEEEEEEEEYGVRGRGDGWAGRGRERYYDDGMSDGNGLEYDNDDVDDELYDDEAEYDDIDDDDDDDDDYYDDYDDEDGQLYDDNGDDDGYFQDDLLLDSDDDSYAGEAHNRREAAERRGSRVVGGGGGGGASRHRGRESGGGRGRGSGPRRRAARATPRMQQIKERLIVAQAGLKTKMSGVTHKGAKVIRELKGSVSSDLEKTLIKATRPDNDPAKRKHVNLLLQAAEHAFPVYMDPKDEGMAYWKEGPYWMTLHKLWRRMAEKDYRTAAKALYVLHRLARGTTTESWKYFRMTLAQMRREEDKGTKSLYFSRRVIRNVDEDGRPYSGWLDKYGEFALLRMQTFAPDLAELATVGAETSHQEASRALAKAEKLIEAALACELEPEMDNDVTCDCLKLVIEDLCELWSLFQQKLEIRVQQRFVEGGFSNKELRLTLSFLEFYLESLAPARDLVEEAHRLLAHYSHAVPKGLGGALATDMLQEQVAWIQEELTEQAKASMGKNFTDDNTNDDDENGSSRASAATAAAANKRKLKQTIRSSSARRSSQAISPAAAPASTGHKRSSSGAAAPLAAKTRKLNADLPPIGGADRKAGSGMVRGEVGGGGSSAKSGVSSGSSSGSGRSSAGRDGGKSAAGAKSSSGTGGESSSKRKKNCSKTGQSSDVREGK